MRAQEEALQALKASKKLKFLAKLQISLTQILSRNQECNGLQAMAHDQRLFPLTKHWFYPVSLLKRSTNKPFNLDLVSFCALENVKRDKLSPTYDANLQSTYA